MAEVPPMPLASPPITPVDEGEPYLEVLLEDGKPGKNRVIVKIKPERIFAWDFRKQQGSESDATA